MKNINILITGAGAFVANSVISNFKNINERTIKIIGCDIKDYVSSINLLDKYYKIPKYSDSNYIEELLKIADKENIDIIVPLIDFEIIQITENINKFKKFKLLMLNASNVNQILDKANLFNILKNNNIAIPNYFIAKNYKEFKTACKKLNYQTQPICFKPAISSGSRGFRIIDNRISEYELLLEKPNSVYIDYKKVNDILKSKKVFPKLLVMEYLPNESYVIHILAKNGKIIYQVACKVISELSSNLIEGEIIYDQEIIDYCKKVTSLLKIDGIFGIELKKDKNNILKMLEINPRIQGSISICNSLGINLPYFAIKQLYNEKSPDINLKKNILIIRSYQETYIELSK